MFPKCELRHNRSLLNSNFQGYSFKNRILKKIVKQLPHEIMTYNLSTMAENSLYRTKLYSKFNPLTWDPYNEHVVYFVTKDLFVMSIDLIKVAVNENDGFLREIFDINLHIKKESSRENYTSLVFIDENFVTVNMNETNILLLKTGDRSGDKIQWNVVFNYEIEEEFKLSQFLILSGLARVDEIEIALLTCRNSDEFQNISRGAEIIVLQFKNESNTWSCMRKRRIFCKSVPDFIALDGNSENSGIIVISSDDNFRFFESPDELQPLEDTVREETDQGDEIKFNYDIPVEDVDSESMNTVFILRFDIETTKISYNLFYRNSRFICQLYDPVSPQSHKPRVPSICLQNDVDAVIFSHENVDSMWKHVNTLDAFSYIELSKVNRRFTQISSDCKFGVICDSTSNLMIYLKDAPLAENMVLTDRKRGQRITSNGELYVANFEFGQCAEAMIALPQLVALLFKKSIVAYLL